MAESTDSGADTGGNDLQQFQQHQVDFAAHIRDPDNVPAPENIESRRMNIYRELFFNNVVNFLAKSFPVLVDLLGNKRWRALIRDYYRDHASHSPLFPDMPKEFLKYLADERAVGKHSDTEPDPPFLYELAHYEWVEIGLSLAEEPAPDDALNPNGALLDDRPVTSPLAWLLSYQYPVNKIGKEFQPDSPSEQPHLYIVLRNPELKIVFLSLNLISARLFELLRDNPDESGRDILLTIATELDHPDPEAIVDSGLGIMEQWLDKGVLLGTLPAN